MRKRCLLPVLLLGGCISMLAPQGTQMASPEPSVARCSTDNTDHYVGERATEGLGETILAATGARILRWGGPDTVFTMEYREDRVNALYDDVGRITRIYCG